MHLLWSQSCFYFRELLNAPQKLELQDRWVWFGPMTFMSSSPVVSQEKVRRTEGTSSHSLMARFSFCDNFCPPEASSWKGCQSFSRAQGGICTVLTPPAPRHRRRPRGGSLRWSGYTAACRYIFTSLFIFLLLPGFGQQHPTAPLLQSWTSAPARSSLLWGGRNPQGRRNWVVWSQGLNSQDCRFSLVASGSPPSPCSLSLSRFWLWARVTCLR